MCPRIAIVPARTEGSQRPAAKLTDQITNHPKSCDALIWP